MAVVVGYVRVSGTAQAEDGLGLDIQREAIVDYCIEAGHTLAALHSDEGVSGTLAERHGLTGALADVEFGAAEAIVVYRLDRLARDLLIQETVIERLHRRGRRVLSVAEADIDGEDPTRVLVRQVLGAIAQYERAVIVARMQAGRAAKAARGGFAYGSPAFGYHTTEKELVVDDDEQATLRRIIELRGVPRMSLRKMGRILEVEGHRPKRAEHWHPAVLGRLVKRLEREGAHAAAPVPSEQRGGASPAA